MADKTVVGQPRSALDMIVVATAVAHGLTIASAHEKPFRDAGVAWINPLETSC